MAPRSRPRVLGPIELRLDGRFEPVGDGARLPELEDPAFARVLALLTSMASNAGARLSVGPLTTAVLTYEGSHVAFAPLPEGGVWVVISPASAQPGLVLSHLRRRLSESERARESEPEESR